MVRLNTQKSEPMEIAFQPKTRMPAQRTLQVQQKFSAAHATLLSSIKPIEKQPQARTADVHENKAFSLLSKAFMELLESNEWRLGRLAHETLQGITFCKKDVELIIPFLMNLSHEPNFEKAAGSFLTALISHPHAEGLALDLSHLPKGIQLSIGCRERAKNVSMLLPKGACSTMKTYENYYDEWDNLLHRYELLLINPHKDLSYSSIRMLTNCPNLRMHEGKIEYDERGGHFDRWEG